MNNNNYIKQNINEYLDVIVKKGCPFEAALSLLKNNSSLLHYTPAELDRKISFISNHKSLYAALLIDGNMYAWSIYRNGQFDKFVKSVSVEDKNKDYIVDMVLDFIYNNKMYKNDSDMVLEDAVIKFKKNVTNITGYHLR